MIHITQHYYQRTLAAIAETRDWIASHPTSDLVPEYEIHAAALLMLLSECKICPDRGSRAELESQDAFSVRLREIKQLVGKAA